MCGNGEDGTFVIGEVLYGVVFPYNLVFRMGPAFFVLILIHRVVAIVCYLDEDVVGVYEFVVLWAVFASVLEVMVLNAFGRHCTILCEVRGECGREGYRMET